jgi:hypothetical protein
MTGESHSNIIELIRAAVARGQAQRAQDRSYLLLEDLVDDPIEWSLRDIAQAAGGAATTPAVSLH